MLVTKIFFVSHNVLRRPLLLWSFWSRFCDIGLISDDIVYFNFVFSRLIDAFLPPDKKIDFSKKTFQPTTTQAFAIARERERIGIFLSKTQEFGVPNTNIFQTDYLYEKTNLVHVCACIRAIGIEVSIGQLVLTLPKQALVFTCLS